jgi:predicted PurR-regulated permease PerM
MTWEGIAAICAVVMVMFTIMGFVFYAGQFSAMFQALKDQVVALDSKNSKQHEEFYAARDTVNELSGNHKNMDKRMDSIDGKLDTLIQSVSEIRFLPVHRQRPTKGG